jgi:hypothetical protein
VALHDSTPACRRLAFNHYEPSPSSPAEPRPEELPVDDEPANDDAADEDPAVAARSPTA